MKRFSFFTHCTRSGFKLTRIATVFLLICTLSLSSCYHYRISSLGDPDSVLIQQKTQVNYLWGFIQPKDLRANCEGINKVRISTNLGYILLSVVTVGIVVPQKVEWVCAAENPPADTLTIIPFTPKKIRSVK